MSLISPPELFADATDAKDTVDSNTDSPDKVIQPTALVATVIRRELWSYYLYYNCENGVGPLGYTQTLFQSLATSAGHDPTIGPGSSCTTSGPCVLPWMGGTKAVASIVLIANGMSFAIMTAIFTTIGSAADYGTFGRWLLFAITAICWAAQYACMALMSPDRWRLAMGLYIVGFVSYGATLVFYAAAFPRLARNTPRTRSLREKYDNGYIPVEEYEKEESLEKNRISNMSTVHCNISYVATSLLNLALLLPPKTANDPKVDNYTLALYVLSSLIRDSMIATTRIEFYSEYGGSNISLLAQDLLYPTDIVTILIPLWGMIGIWTNKYQTRDLQKVEKEVLQVGPVVTTAPSRNHRLPMGSAISMVADMVAYRVRASRSSEQYMHASRRRASRL